MPLRIYIYFLKIAKSDVMMIFGLFSLVCQPSEKEKKSLLKSKIIVFAISLPLLSLSQACLCARCPCVGNTTIPGAAAQGRAPATIAAQPRLPPLRLGDINRGLRPALTSCGGTVLK